MTVDPIDDDLFSFMDNAVSGKTRTVYSLPRAANWISSSRRHTCTSFLRHHKPVMRCGKQTMTMAKRMRRSPNLSNLDVMEKRTEMISSNPLRC